MSEGQSFFDKAKDMAGELKDKAQDFMDGDDESTDDAGDEVDPDQGTARDAADRMGGDDQGMGR
jgi:hypothetical protein